MEPITESVRKSQSKRQTQEIPADHAAESYLELLAGGHPDELRTLFTGKPVISEPMWGSPETDFADFEKFVARAHVWMSRHSAEVDHLVTTRSIDPATNPRGERAVAEQVLILGFHGRRVDLPVAVVADDSNEGERQIRVYHSTWPMSGDHQARPPVLSARADVEQEVKTRLGAVSQYHRSLAKGDLDGVLAAFIGKDTIGKDAGGEAGADEAIVREPAGGAYFYRGKKELRRLYENMFSNGGGIELEYGAITDDGVRCAIEYNVRRWGQTEIRPQAGIAVYERGAGGLLRAVRIYDDVSPPVQ